MEQLAGVVPRGTSRGPPRIRMKVFGKCAMMTNFQCPSESGGLRNPQTSAQLPGIDPGPHNGEGPGGIGKAHSAKASSMVLMLFLLSHRRAAPLKSPATKSTKHHSTNRKDKLLSYATFLGVNVTDVQRQNCECFLAAERLSTKRGT